MCRDLAEVRKILSAGVVGLAVLSWACHKKPTASAPQLVVPPLPPSTVAPAPIPATIPSSIPKPPAGPTYFELGELYFKNGDYANAARAYETYLRDNYAPVNQDLAVFRLALCHEFQGSSVRNLPQATRLLRQLVKRFPQSPYRPQAEFLLGLQGEVEKLRTDVATRDDRIKELTQELEKLKQIDMERRPTGTPP